MDSHDIAFRFQARSKSYATVMLRQAVLRPFFGRMRTERQANAAFLKVLGLWRTQLVAMHHAGLSVSKSKIMRARNCPPPGSGGERNLQPCEMRLCPFCYTRQLLLLRERITTAFKKLDDISLLTYTLWINDPDKRTEQIHADDEFNCWPSIAAIINTHKTVRDRIRDRLFDKAYGSACLMTVVPHAFQEPVGSLTGYISTKHRCIGLVPSGIEIDAPANGKLFERQRLTQQMLMLTLSRMFTYPVEWLRTNPKLMVEFTAAAHKQRLFTRTGVLRDLKK